MPVIWLALLLLGLSLAGAAQAADTLDAWRIEAAQTRLLAENDPPRAYQEAQRLERSLPADATPADRARVWNLLSRAELYLALTDLAAEHARLALDLAALHGDRIGQAEAQLNTTLIAINQSKIDGSVVAATRSLELLEGVNRSDLLGEALLRMSMTYRRLGDLDNSVTMAMQAMEMAKRSKDPLALTYAHQGLAISFDQSNRYQEASEHYLQMREQARAAPSKWLEAHAVRGLAGVTTALGDVARGERLMREAVAMFRALRVPTALGYGLYGLGEAMRAQGRHAEAVPILDEVIAIYARYQNQIGLWWGLKARSEEHQTLGHVVAARADAQRAYALARQINILLYKSESAKRLAAIAADVGDHRQAYQLTVEASDLADQMVRERTNTRMVELAQRYESESKQREINELTRRNEQQTAELQRHVLQQRWLWTVLGGSAFVLAGGTYFLLRQQRSNRLLATLNRQVRRSENQLQATLDAIPDSLFVLGLDGRYYDVRTPRADLLAAPVEDLVGKTIFEVLPPDAAAICQLALREADEKGASAGKQFELPLAHGKSWFELSVSRKLAELGQEPRFIVLSRDITERKRLEEGLAASEREFRALAENSPDPIIRYDRGCRRLYANPVVGRLFGRPVEELIGKSPADGAILVSEENKKLMQAIHHVFDSGGSLHIDLDVVAQDGQYRIHQVHLVPERNALGQVVTVLALARDITERQRMEEALREREQRYRGIFDNVLDTLYLLEVTPDGHFRNLEVNPAFEKSSGISSAELVGKLIEETVPEEAANIAIAKYRKCIEAGRAIEEEVSLDMPIGRRHYHSTLIPVRDERGRIHRIVGISRDVTERKQAQELLHAREQAFRAVAENSPDIIARYDTQCRRVYVNPAMQALFGLPLDAILGKTSAEQSPLTQVFAATHLETVREVLGSGQEQQREFSFHTIRGEARWGHMRLVPELARDGSVASVLAVTRDITSLKATEARLEESRHLLRQLAARNEVVREDERKHISREIHDELGQYLQALRMGVSVVDVQFGVDSAPLQEQTQRLLEMVDATIKVVRNVVASLRPAALDMGIVSALEWLVGEYSGRTGLQFQLQVGEEDIELDDSCTTALFRIVQESLTNVVRHAQASKVKITLVRDDAHYLLEVRDNGQGFDPALRKEKSFGLVSIRERVLMLGGDVNVASAPGQSTAIRVHIPTHKARSES